MSKDERPAIEQQEADHDHSTIGGEEEGKPPPQKGRQEAQPTKNHRKNWARRLAPWSTVAVAVFTGTLTIVGYLQWQSMQQTLEYAERPWLILTTIETAPLAADVPIVVRYVLTNSGHTPAYILEESFTLSVSDKDIPPDPRTSTKPKRSSAITVPPNRDHLGNTTTPLLLPSETIDLINQGKRFFHVYGYITYRDIFEKVHTSLFCATYAPQNRPPYTLFQFSKQPSCQYAD